MAPDKRHVDDTCHIDVPTAERTIPMRAARLSPSSANISPHFRNTNLARRDGVFLLMRPIMT